MITIGATTMMACPDGSLNSMYRATAGRSGGGGPDGAGNLALETAGGEQRMLFVNGVRALNSSFGIDFNKFRS